MFRGSMVAIVTPMDKTGEIDVNALTDLVDFHLQNQTAALVVVGTTGESATMSLLEQQTVIQHVVKQVKSRIPVIAGTCAVSTKKTIELTRQAMELGVDACLIMTPPYIKPTQEGLYVHYRAIAEAVAIPQILYNVPGRTAVDLLPETIERLSHIANIIGVKEATACVDRAEKIRQLCGESMDIYSGEDSATLALMRVGAKGVISVTANVAPKLMQQMCVAALDGDFDTANAINQRLQVLHDVLFIESNPIPVKWALHQMGLIGTGIRLPLTVLAEEYRQDICKALEQVALI